MIAVENGNGAAIIPACRLRQAISFLGDVLFDYRDMLAAGDESVSAMAWRELAHQHLPLGVTAVRGTDRCGRWQAMGLPTETFVAAPCLLRSHADALSFEAHHHRSARLLRRFARAGVTFQEHSEKDTALVRTVYERKAEQVVASGQNLFADPARREFLVAAATLGSCDVFTLKSAGTLVAALVTFRDGNVRRFYATYYDRSWAHLSPRNRAVI